MADAPTVNGNDIPVVQPVVQAPTTKPNPTEVLRKLSKEFAVDLFSEGGIESLMESLKAKDTEYHATKTKAEKLEESVKENQVKIEALGLGFSLENLDEVLALAKVNIKENQTISDGLKAVKEKYAKVFVTQQNIGTQHNGAGDKPDLQKTEVEQYLAGSKAYQIYHKKDKK